jgi:hypothetical protein
MKISAIPLAVLGVFACVSFASAKTYPIPGDDPIGTVSIPDAWSVDTYEGGVEGTSPDGKIYVAVEEVDADDVKGALTDGLKFFKDQGLEIDEAKITTKDTKLNGMDALDIDLPATDKNGPTSAGLTLVTTNANGKFLMIYDWGSDNDVQANIKDIQSIGASIQATK